MGKIYIQGDEDPDWSDLSQVPVDERHRQLHGEFEAALIQSVNPMLEQHARVMKLTTDTKEAPPDSDWTKRVSRATDKIKHNNDKTQ